jgi:hypothetical protein
MVDVEISENWFHKHFVPKHPFLKRGLQKVLLLDSACSHPSDNIVIFNNGPTVVKMPPQVSQLLCTLWVKDRLHL